jgi:D-methionine transport system substrate-binding protein
MHRIDRRRMLVGLTTGILLAGLVGCGSGTEVSYEPVERADEDTLLVYVGPGEYREVLQHAVDTLLPASAKIQLADAPPDANARVEAGDADLVFAQQGPVFDAEKVSHPSLSVVSKVNVVPYALYSSKWKDLSETQSWVNTGIVADEVVGQSLPHGSRVVLPAATESFARGLYLLQSAHLVQLDRPFGGSSPVDLTISEANVVDSLRHLSLLGLSSDIRLPEVYREFDALVLAPQQAAVLGLDPGRDALAVEPGPGNPYATVLVAPSRLAGDPRVLQLTHALESPELAHYLETTHPGANLPATAVARR